jgi:ubiquitin-protein ligase
LSILGTWSGESEDEWRSSYSINYILSAIQSLIMTAKPYHNEPGYEEARAAYLYYLILIWN